jgi:hypothetical protein
MPAMAGIHFKPCAKPKWIAAFATMTDFAFSVHIQLKFTSTAE